MTGWSKNLTIANGFSPLCIRLEFRQKLAFYRLVHGLKWPWEDER